MQVTQFFNNNIKSNTNFNKILPYILMLLILAIFNWEAIFGVDWMIQDDMHYYYLLNLKKRFWDWVVRRTIFNALFVHGIINVAYYSLNLARILCFLFLVFPSSAILFYIYRKKVGLPLIVSISAAIFPFIIPTQLLIPTYLAGNYFFIGLIFGLLALIFGFKYLNAQRSKIFFLIISMLFYFIAI